MMHPEDRPLTVQDLTRIPPRNGGCGVCGATIANLELHKDWHRFLATLIAD